MHRFFKTTFLFNYLFLRIFLVLLICHFSFTNKQKCDICKKFTRKFSEGLQKTSGQNFGGGNTNWEENYLGKYLKSETRLIEILEQSCDSDKKECHQFTEEAEEVIENWWFEVYHKENEDSINKNLEKFLCQNTLKLCCEEGSYGKECKECPGGKKAPCGGRGRCKDSGYRVGKGVCECDTGYTGDTCSHCSVGYFKEGEKEEKNGEEGEEEKKGEKEEKKGEEGEKSSGGGKFKCSACPPSCKTSCQSSDSKTCDSCKSGWLMQDGRGCVDVNECTEGTANCTSSQYCLNKDGSFQCIACHQACEGCTGDGNKTCIECSARHFRLDDACAACHPSCNNTCTDQSPATCDSCALGWTLGASGCEDQDECAIGGHTCSSSQYCSNTEGSFSCIDCSSSCGTCSSKDLCLSCHQGSKLSADGKCEDINECEDSKDICKGPFEQCVNEEGTYRCDCQSGYVRRHGSACFKKQETGAARKKKEKEEKKERERKEMEEKEEANKRKRRPSPEEAMKVVSGPNGFSKEDIEKLGDPLEPQEETVSLKGEEGKFGDMGRGRSDEDPKDEL